MGKCLVTKLNGSIANEELRKIGEARIHFAEGSEVSKRYLNLKVSKPVTLKIHGGYFINKETSANIGTVVNITDTDRQVETYFSNDKCYISISDKYCIKVLRAGNEYDGDLEEINFMTSMEDFFNVSTSISGDIANARNCKSLIIFWIDSCKNIYGDIAVFANLPSIKKISLINVDKVGGDIASLSNIVNQIEVLNIYGTSVHGDFTFLKDSKLNTLNFKSVKGFITGDLSLFGESIKTTNFERTSNSLSWSSEIPSSYNVRTCIGGYFENDLDKYLINIAKCQAINSTNIWDKIITVSGKRTSASDAAITTLQQKGYTVSIS